MSSFSDSVLSAIDKQKDINSMDKEKMIVGLHGINFPNFITVTESGGFANPSMALMKINKDRKDEKDFRFASGSILVAFKPEVIFDGKLSAPKANNQTIISTGDGYTVRAPAEHLKLNKSSLNRLESRLIELDSPYIDKLYSLRLSSPDNSWLSHFNNFSESPLMKHLFIDEQGLDLPVPMKRVKPKGSGFPAHLLKSYPPKRLEKILSDIPNNVDVLREAFVAYTEERYSKFKGDIKLEEFVAGEIQEAKELDTNKIVSHAMKADREITPFLQKKMQIDTKKLDETLKKALSKSGGHAAYLNWVTSKVRNMTSDKYFLADDKKITSERKVVEYITQKRGVGQEGLSNVSVGELKSYSTERVNSFKELFDKSGLLTRVESEYKDDALADALSNFRVAIGSATSVSSTHEEGDAVRVCVKEFCLKYDSDIKSVARRAHLDHLSNDELSKIQDVGMKLKEAFVSSSQKVPYFEAVINERVGFDQVECIVVPKDWLPAVTNFLERNKIRDVNIKTYNPSVDGSQMKQIPASLNLEKHAQKIEKANKLKRRNNSKCAA